VLTAGLAFSGLALCYWFFDIRGHSWVAWGLRIYGMNAIAVFVGSGILARTLLYLRIGDVPLQKLFYQAAFASWLPPHMASLAYAVTWVLGFFLILSWMYRRRIFIKI
jgi:predicted acyltransferase